MRKVATPLIAVLFILFCPFKGKAQEVKVYSTANAHSHNDYVNDTPFYKAFKRAFGSIEADVYPVNGSLLVAHSRKEIRGDRTLRKLYLEPLKEGLEKNCSRQLNLLIDIKENYEQALPLMVRELRPVKHLVTTPHKKRRLMVLISGNRPHPSLYKSYPDFVFFDADLTVPHTPNQWKRVGLVSLQFTRYSTWKGVGPVQEDEAVRVRHLIDSVHAAGKPIRFWAAPDNPLAWSQLMQWGVDYIGTDKINELADFISRQKQASYSSRKP